MQPQWKFICNLGDANPLDHGGKFLFKDETGNYEPEIEVVEPLYEEGEDDDEYNDDGELIAEGNKVWEVHRFSIDKCTFIDGVLSDNKHHPEHEVWFAKDIENVANSAGRSKEEFIEDLCGDDLVKRAMAYMDIAGYWGIVNFDQYPIYFGSGNDKKYDFVGGQKEIEERYKECV